jgi:hypothetical protein
MRIRNLVVTHGIFSSSSSTPSKLLFNNRELIRDYQWRELEPFVVQIKKGDWVSRWESNTNIDILTLITYLGEYKPLEGDAFVQHYPIATRHLTGRFPVVDFSDIRSEEGFWERTSYDKNGKECT